MLSLPSFFLAFWGYSMCLFNISFLVLVLVLTPLPSSKPPKAKSILNDKSDHTKATVFCRYENDVTPFKEFFEQTTEKDPRFKFKCVSCSSSALPDDSEFSNFIPPPDPSLKIVLCGAPKHVLAWETSLRERSYTPGMLYNFFQATQNVLKAPMPPLSSPTAPS
jgi:hypothetical protein